MKRDKLLIALEVLQEEEKELLLELDDVRRRTASYKRKLSELAKSSSDSEPTFFESNTPQENDDYDHKAAWVDKIAFFLNKEKRFLHSRELQQMIDDHEPGLDKATLQRRVSSALARLKKEKSAVNYKAGKTNHSVFWGSPNWLDEDGKPKKGHEFNADYLNEKKGQKRIIL